MRRVYDDEMFLETQQKINKIIWQLKSWEVSSYSYGTDRFSATLAAKAILEKLNKDGELYMLGKNTHANGIGNNNEYEVIYLGNPKEQQICCALHLTEGLYGEGYLFTTDIDGARKSNSRKM